MLDVNPCIAKGDDSRGPNMAGESLLAAERRAKNGVAGSEKFILALNVADRFRAPKGLFRFFPRRTNNALISVY